MEYIGSLKYSFNYRSIYNQRWSDMVMKSKGRILLLEIYLDMPIVKNIKSILVETLLYIFGSFINPCMFIMRLMIFVLSRSVIVSPELEWMDSLASMSNINWWVLLLQYIPLLSFFLICPCYNCHCTVGRRWWLKIFVYCFPSIVVKD